MGRRQLRFDDVEEKGCIGDGQGYLYKKEKGLLRKMNEKKACISVDILQNSVALSGP